MARRRRPALRYRDGVSDGLRESECKFASLSVQLLTVPTIAAALVARRGTLHVLLSALDDCFRAYAPSVVLWPCTAG